jgi:hypothetical protein
MRRCRGFGIIDAVMGVLAVTLIVILVGVNGAGRRGVGAAAESVENLRQIGSITTSYGADYQNRMWGLSWTPQVQGPSNYPELLTSARQGELQAAAAQAIDIIRRRSIFTNHPLPPSWFPQLHYSHLVLADYLDMRLPLNMLVSPGDRHRRQWSENPAGFVAGAFFPYQPDPADFNSWRWTVSSSYELPPAFWSPDAVTATTGAVVQSSNHYTYQIYAPTGGGSPFNGWGPRPLTQVRFPSNKVLMSDTGQWHGGRRDLYYLSDDARVPILMVDGSARVRISRDANQGFQPANPTSPSYTPISSYDRRPWEPEAHVPAGGLRARWRYTRWGIRGRDFEGQEVTAP